MIDSFELSVYFVNLWYIFLAKISNNLIRFLAIFFLIWTIFLFSASGIIKKYFCSFIVWLFNMYDVTFKTDSVLKILRENSCCQHLMWFKLVLFAMCCMSSWITICQLISMKKNFFFSFLNVNIKPLVNMIFILLKLSSLFNQL